MIDKWEPKYWDPKYKRIICAIVTKCADEELEVEKAIDVIDCANYKIVHGFDPKNDLPKYKRIVCELIKKCTDEGLGPKDSNYVFERAIDLIRFRSNHAKVTREYIVPND